MQGELLPPLVKTRSLSEEDRGRWVVHRVPEGIARNTI
jgi:hypothetical protein